VKNWKRKSKTRQSEKRAHIVQVRDLDGKLGVDFGLELGAGMTMEQSRDVLMRIEKKIHAESSQFQVNGRATVAR